ncbi:S-layer homology domain-containing protein [Chengkuizengella axinellae]|uniref:S-layer homology domain-containing protein n=1 Tax=Chengkuizengella axinellae TaxID=3064388 RepID=A0ABT9IZ82_9BACL|nr:S-layer homology domain-containing protein [Chengkuizengella sp. 2205SS18-9]MDP5274632.1 S-layer homology domain-containing protein [Chengkuizengella sp. 2205SS18-9]
MKSFKRPLSVIMIFAMLLALLPPLGSTSFAAVNLEIQGYPISAERPANPYSTIQELIELRVGYTQIDDADLSDLYYVIEEVNTGVFNEVKNNPPEIDGVGFVKFTDVQLYEGLNKITVKLDSGTNPQSLPAWVNYTEITTINELTIDERQFINGMIVPLENPSTDDNTIFIEGIAPNATSLLGYTTLDPLGVYASFFRSGTGQFSFSAGEDESEDLHLRPGDNELKILASSADTTYNTKRTFVYNNGDNFVYNTEVFANTNLDTPTESMLFKQPTFSASNGQGGYEIDFVTDVKINRNEEEPTHSTLKVEVEGTGTSYDVIFSVDEDGTSSYSIGGVVTGIQDEDIEIEEEYYLINDISISGIAINPGDTEQTLTVSFLPSQTGYSQNTLDFDFYFINETQPFVKEVYETISSTKLFSGIEITVLTETLLLDVVTEQDADGVKVYSVDSFGDETFLASSSTKNTEDDYGTDTITYIVTLDKDDLPEGRSTLKFVPYKDDNGDQTDFEVGAKEFEINYNPSPYVYLTNISKAQDFDSANEPSGIEPDGDTFTGPVFQIKPVNIPPSQWDDIRVIFNDQVDKIRDTDHYEVNSIFEEFRFYFGNNNTDKHDREDWALQNGLNELIIEIYPQGTLGSDGDPGAAEPISSFKYEMFYYTSELPEVLLLEVESEFLEDHHYVQESDYRYYTQETELQFITSVASANEVEFRFSGINEDGEYEQKRVLYEWDDTHEDFDMMSLSVYEDKYGKEEDLDYDYDDFIDDVEEDSAPSGSLSGWATFTSEELDLEGTGTFAVEIIARNTSNHLINTRTIEIGRDPATFVVHYPTIDPVTKTGFVNGNYTRIYVEAENADKIIYDRKEEVTSTEEIEIDNNELDLFVFEISDLKKGDNKIKFTVVRGTQEDEVEIILINADTPVPGAEYKESISKTKIDAFDKAIELSFPKGTILLQNNASDGGVQVLSPTRDILLAIADSTDGRVNKTLHPFSGENSRFDSVSDNFIRIFDDPAERYRAISDLYWVDGGIVSSIEDQEEILYGSGMYPYERDQEFYDRDVSEIDEQYVPSNPGELTLKYDPNVVDSAWRYVTVYHYGYNVDYMDNESYEWVNLGGEVDEKKNTITVPFTEFGYYVVMYMNESFDDVIGHPWAKNYLDTLYSKGIMTNRASSTQLFEPDEPISRGEFTSLIVKAFDLPLNYAGPESDRTFSDVRKRTSSSDGLYEYKYIETAARAGIVRGKIDDQFLPDLNLTREDASTIIARAANLRLDTNESKVNTALNKVFVDAEDINSYARASVLGVYKEEIIQGKQVISDSNANETYYFDPQANMTRAEAAAIVMRILLNEKKIPNL